MTTIDPTQPALAGVTDRDAVARTAFDAAYPLTDKPNYDDPLVTQTWLEIADAVLAVLHTRTEQEVRADERKRIADSLRNMRTTDDDKPVTAFHNVADWLERGDGR